MESAADLERQAGLRTLSYKDQKKEDQRILHDMVTFTHVVCAADPNMS